MTTLANDRVRSVLTSVVLGVWGLICATGAAQIVVGSVTFQDRAARGEIVLGDIRGSIGIIDYDNDGWFDLYIADIAGRPDRLFHNAPSPTAPGGRTFVDATALAGLDDSDGMSRGSGSVVVFDYNNDGFSDVFTAGYATDTTSGLLYRNNGDGTFSNVSVSAGVRVAGIVPESASATDFDHDGDVDLLICPIIDATHAIILLQNNGNATFTSRPDLLPVPATSGRCYAHGWTDYDDDGWTDALVCINSGVPLTLRNVPNPAGGRRFIDATASSGFTHVGPAPMGIAMGDYDGDGDLDVAITDASVGTYYENVAGMLSEVTPFATFFGWGTTWLDAENDGDLDNYQAGSYSASNIDFIWRNDGLGQWTNARAALNTTSLPSQYCARVDFDNDGREDIITINPGRFISVYHNQSPSGHHWAKVRLRGHATTHSNPTSLDAVGAVVRLTAGNKTLVRELGIGSSFAATEDLRAHFGLGTATVIDRIEVRWPRRGTPNERTDVYLSLIHI